MVGECKNRGVWLVLRDSFARECDHTQTHLYPYLNWKSNVYVWVELHVHQQHLQFDRVTRKIGSSLFQIAIYIKSLHGTAQMIIGEIFFSLWPLSFPMTLWQVAILWLDFITSYSERHLYIVNVWHFVVEPSVLFHFAGPFKCMVYYMHVLVSFLQHLCVCFFLFLSLIE